MSSRTEILRSQITGCSNPASNPSLNQRALKEIWEGEEKFNTLKGKARLVVRRQARRMQTLQDQVQPPSLPDTIQPEIS